MLTVVPIATVHGGVVFCEKSTRIRTTDTGEQSLPSRYGQRIYFCIAKPFKMKMKETLFCLFVLFSLFSCQNEDTQKVSEAKVDVPELLQRGDNLLKGEEWDLVQNQYAGALKDLRAGENVNDAYIRLAEVYMTEARITGEHGHYYPAAIEVLERVKASELEPTDIRFRALSDLASVQLSQHDFAAAKTTAEEAIKISPYNAQIYGALVDANVELGNYETAVKACDKMMSIRPDLRSYSRVSYLREIHGDIQGSLEAMKMAADAGYPGYEQTAWTRLTLGDMLMKYGKPEAAVSQYENALAQRENYPFAIAALADAEIHKGNHEKGEEMLKKACDIIPEFGYYVQLAQLYYDTDRKEEADKLMDEIWVMLQDDVDSGHNMNMEYADLYLNVTEDYDKALSYAQQEFAKRPKNIDVNRMLAQIYLKKGDMAKARKHIDEASRTGAKYPDLLTTRGMIALAEGNKKAAMKDLEESLSINPGQSGFLAVEAKTAVGKPVSMLQK